MLLDESCKLGLLSLERLLQTCVGCFQLCVGFSSGLWINKQQKFLSMLAVAVGVEQGSALQACHSHMYDVRMLNAVLSQTHAARTPSCLVDAADEAVESTHTQASWVARMRTEEGDRGRMQCPFFRCCSALLAILNVGVPGRQLL